MEAKRDELTGRWSLSGVEPSEVTFERICKMLREGINFKFARVGDGELFCMEGKQGHNCDHHQYFHDLGIKLIESLSDDNYAMMGVQPLSVSHMPEVVSKYLGHIEPLYDADTLHTASIDDKIFNLVESIGGRFLIVVGPKHLQVIFYENCTHIVTQLHNCWLSYNTILESIQYWLIPKCVVLLSCGMMAGCLIYDLRDYDCTIIDAGSVWDPYCSVFSRSYHKKLKL